MDQEWTPYGKHKLMWMLSQAGEGSAVEIIPGKTRPWKYRMRVIKTPVKRGTQLSSAKWDEILFHAMSNTRRLLVMMEGNNFFVGVNVDEVLSSVGKVIDFEIVGKAVPNTRNSKKAGIKTQWKRSGVYFYRFGRVLTTDVQGLALYLYDRVDPYTVGQAYAWNNQNDYTPVEFSGENKPFRLDDFVAGGYHYNTRGKVCGVAFLHKTLGVINGLESLHELFPKATADSVRELYREFDLKPSSHVGDFFGVSRTRKPRTKKEDNKVPDPVQRLDEEVNPKRAKLLGYVEELDLRPSSNRKGVYLYHPLKQDDVLVESPEELASQIHICGYSLAKKDAKPLWNLVMEEG